MWISALQGRAYENTMQTLRELDSDKWKINSKGNYLNREYKISQVVNYPENKNNSNVNLGYQLFFLMIPKEGCYSYLLLQAMFSCKLNANVSNTLI